MRLFLTGSTGFIGSHVLSLALASGCEVLALRRNVSSLPCISTPRNPHWVEGDLFTVSSSLLKGVDVVLHLASAGVSPKQATWSEMVQVNVAGSCRLLELAAESGVRRFVSAGSCHEYGNAARHYDFIPPHAALEPITTYGASKAAAFELMRALAGELGIQFFYGRIFSAYGQGQFRDNFWPSLCSAALRGDNFPMTSGSQILDFVPVEIVAEHLLRACNRPDIHADCPLIVNIGSGIATTLLAFAEREWDRLGATGRLLPGALPNRINQIPRYVPDLASL